MIVRTEPLPELEHFEFFPKDLDISDEARSAPESLTFDFAEDLRSLCQSMYRAGFGIQGLPTTYEEWLIALPVIQDRIKG